MIPRYWFPSITNIDPMFWFAMIRNASRTVVSGETDSILLFPLWSRRCETFFILPDFGEIWLFPNYKIFFSTPILTLTVTGCSLVYLKRYFYANYCFDRRFPGRFQ